MKTMKKFIQLSFAALLLTALGTNTSFAAKPTGGGKGGKVTVESANPRSVVQTFEEDVTIVGTGFDDGSEVRFLVTGTDDDSQIEVGTPEFISSTELKVHIKTTGSTATVDYDVEVQATSGRKGKGTTLFKVQSIETGCNGSEPKEPVVAYLTALAPDGDYETQDLYLSSASGCDQYLLLEDASVKVPGDIINNEQEPGSYLVGVRDLRLDIEGNEGVVMWRDREIEIDRLYTLRFTISPTGAVTPDAGGPGVVYVAPSGAFVTPSDIRITSDGEMELLVQEAVRSGGEIVERRLVHVKVTATTMDALELLAGSCPVRDESSNCFYLDQGFRPWWNEDGSLAYINLYSTDGDTAIGRLNRVANVWQPAKVLMTHESQISIIGIRSNGLLAYEWLNYVTRRNGRTNFNETRWYVASIEDPDACTVFECVPSDGTLMAVDADKHPRGWTRNGSLLFAIGTLEIPDVAGLGDTTF
jgi:hypothetical protein